MQIAEFGGSAGIRDEGLLESALARPMNRFHYDGEARIPILAAAYAEALTRNHAFIDGNKRVAFHAMLLFLRLNGYRLSASEAEAAVAMLALSSSDMSSAEFAEWVRLRVTADPAVASGQA